MSFGQSEISRDRGEPISLVLFRYGTDANDIFAYTDGEEDFPFQGVTYRAVPLQIGEITSSGTLDQATLGITVPQDSGIADLFRLRPPSAVVTVIIRQGHVNDLDADFIVGWSGRVTGFEVDAATDEASLGCEPISTSMQRTMLRRHWQYGCPLVLYGPQCRASRAASTVTRVVLGVSGAIVSFDPAWESASRRVKYQGGMAEWFDLNGRREVRRILNCFPDGKVQLGNAADGLSAGGSVNLILGCNHKTGIPSLHDDGDCTPLFNNILNFGGDPWIPLENPVGIKNNFY